MFGAAVAYDEVKYKYTDLQSLVASCFATGQVLHKAYDEIKDFCRLLSSLQPTAWLLGKPCVKPTTKSETELITMMQSLVPNSFAIGQALHKAYDEIIYKYILYNFCRLLKNSSPSAKHRKTAY